MAWQTTRISCGAVSCLTCLFTLYFNYIPICTLLFLQGSKRNPIYPLTEHYFSNTVFQTHCKFMRLLLLSIPALLIMDCSDIQGLDYWSKFRAEHGICHRDIILFLVLFVHAKPRSGGGHLSNRNPGQIY